MWNRDASRGELFDRYLTMLPRLRRLHTGNRYGLYFERLIGFGCDKEAGAESTNWSTFCARGIVEITAELRYKHHCLIRAKTILINLYADSLVFSKFRLRVPTQTDWP